MFFVETRLGEPITALDQKDNILAFGSISGFYGILDIKKNTTKFSNVCEAELIRDLKIVDKFLFIAIGDYNLIKCDLLSLNVLETIHYKHFNHNEYLCSNTISFLDLNKEKKSLKLFLGYFPTIDSKKLELEMTSNSNKHPTFIKDLLTEDRKEHDFSEKFTPKNYSVPMDYKNDKIIYILREVIGFGKDKKEKKKNFQVNIYDFVKEEQNSIELNDITVKLLKIFKSGIIYVKKNKNVYYYDITNQKNTFLFNHSVTIVTLACNENLIATIDKKLKINIYDFDKNGFVCNDIVFYDLEDSAEIKYRFFEMEYPYFSSISNDMFIFTIDFGVIVVDINKQFRS